MSKFHQNISPKGLSVIFDSRLTFNDHLNNVLMKSNKTKGLFVS